MTERATVAQVTQIGAESTAGTAVAASKLLASLELTGGIKVSNQVFRPACCVACFCSTLRPAAQNAAAVSPVMALLMPLPPWPALASAS